MTRDIELTGHLGESNFYPALHILSISLSQMTGTDIWLMRTVIPVGLFALFQLGVYLLIRTITSSSKAGLVGFVLASVPLYASLTTYTPSDTLFFYVPFILYALFLSRKKQSMRTRLPFVLSLLVVPFSHPELVIFLSAFLIFSEFTQLRDRLRSGRGFHNEHIPSATSLFTLIAAFFIWFSSFSAFGISISRLSASFLGEAIQAPIQYYQSLFVRSGLSITDFMWLAIKVEGAHLIYIILAFSLFAYVVQIGRTNQHLRVFAALTAGTIPLLILTVLVDVIIGYGRVMKYLVLLSTILIALNLQMIGSFSRGTNLSPSTSCIGGGPGTRNSGRRYLTIVTFLSLALVVVIASLNLFPSPAILQANGQITAMSLAGTSWLIRFGDDGVESSDTLPFGRYVHAILGFDSSLSTRFALALYQPSRLPPENFNYDLLEYADGGGLFQRYLLIDGYMKSFYCDLFPERGRFTCEDFDRLEVDSRLSLLYTNGEFEVWYVLLEQSNSMR
jgi:hypothetical protein